MKRKLLTLLAAMLVLAAGGQELEAPDYGEFTVDAQIRARGEFRTGLGSVSEELEKSSLFASDRVRLGVGWERKNISMRIAAQHAGLWQNGGQKGTSGKIALHEAWARMTFGPGFFAQVGRQELSYDDERLFGRHDWDPAGRAHDALRLGWEGGRHSVHAVASFNQTGAVVDDVNYGLPQTDLKLYRNMQMLWYHFGAEGQPFQLSLLFSNQGVRSAAGGGTNYMQTFGTHLGYAHRSFFSDASLYYQIGQDRVGQDVRAFLLSANVGMKFSQRWSLSVGDDYMSGSDGMPGTNRTFNLLYGSHHEFCGAMDYFGYNALPLYGLNDLNAKACFTPSRRFDMKMALHWFATGRPINNYLKDPTEEITDPAKIEIMRRYNGKYRFAQNLGAELDIEASYRPWPFVTLRAGYGLLVASETMQLFKGADASTVHNHGWLSFDLSPTIFSTRHRRR